MLLKTIQGNLFSFILSVLDGDLDDLDEIKEVKSRRVKTP